MAKIVFVCSGNICRSAMAEGIARSMLAEAGLEFASAGTWGGRGDAATRNAIDASGPLVSDSHTTSTHVYTDDVITLEIDLGASYDLDCRGTRLEVCGSIQNVLDRNPPFKPIWRRKTRDARRPHLQARVPIPDRR